MNNGFHSTPVVFHFLPSLRQATATGWSHVPDVPPPNPNVPPVPPEMPPGIDRPEFPDTPTPPVQDPPPQPQPIIATGL